MKKYKIEIEEILQRVVDVEADNLAEALDKVQEQYDNEEITLDYNDFKDVDIRQYIPYIEMGNDDKRYCSECGNEMTQGYCINDGLEYYCNDDCLHKHYTQEEYDKMYDSDYAYWTEWE